MEVNFDELDLSFEYEKAREEWFAYSAKSEILHEMLMELKVNGDFESETVKFLEVKRDFISEHRDKMYDIQKYLHNLKNGYPFHVRNSVGRYMVRFGLTSEQAEMFLSVHKQHMAAMGSDNQKKYSLPNVRNIKWDEEEHTINVYYEDTWWHYDKRGCWY